MKQAGKGKPLPVSQVLHCSASPRKSSSCRLAEDLHHHPSYSKQLVVVIYDIYRPYMVCICHIYNVFIFNLSSWRGTTSSSSYSIVVSHVEILKSVLHHHFQHHYLNPVVVLQRNYINITLTITITSNIIISLSSCRWSTLLSSHLIVAMSNS